MLNIVTTKVFKFNLINFFFVYLLEISSRYCQSIKSVTCCSQNMEIKLVNLAKTQLEKNAKESIQKLTTFLRVRAQKFNGKWFLHFFI